MIPPVISRDIQKGIKSFLETTFPSTTPTFDGCLKEFLNRPGEVFKGPYFGLRLPFCPALEAVLPFSKIRFPYRPHRHQARAFERLCGEEAKSTLVATGTGSGKTECFLYPVLDACAERAGEPGIKAILIYPMNALATDQAKRVAQAIYEDEALRGKVTAGLFIGGESDNAVEMKPDWLITDKAHMRQHPPDILLTNYKMLDFLLLKPEEQELWRNNHAKTLRFLVVDELHTFDGAQSTDLACLIRRLKTRLRSPENHLCCVGTSATLGSEGSGEALLEYASIIFSEPFQSGSVIGEDVLRLNDVVDGLFIEHHGVPNPEAVALLEIGRERNPKLYLQRVFDFWFSEAPPADFHELDGRMALGQKLREHSFFRNLLMLAEKSGRKVLPQDWLLHELGKLLPGKPNPERLLPLVDSFFALCSHALYRDPLSHSTGPLLRLHVHLWTRELARIVASVGPAPKIAFSDDLKEEARKTHLPVLHCRDCGVMGWGGTQRANSDKISPSLQDFYKCFFNREPGLRMIFPVAGSTQGPQMEFVSTLCGHCLSQNPSGIQKCKACGKDDRLVEVMIHSGARRSGERTIAETSCPYCESASGLLILGSRSASLTSVAFGQIFTSPFNGHKKSLAFSDNVQDASHRAGFFTARNYRNNLRTAICQVIRATPQPLTLPELEKSFLEYWHGKMGASDFAGSLIAPDMEWLLDYDFLRKEGKLPTGSNLLNLVNRRLGYEMTAEFGFNSRIGRTLEKTGVAIACVPMPKIILSAETLSQTLKQKAGGFGSVDTGEIVHFINGFLHRLRTSGGVLHPETQAFFSSGGDTYLHNTRQIHLPAYGKTSRAPTFFYIGPTALQRFERVVATGASLTWSQKWAIKSIRSAGTLSAESAGIVIEEAIRTLKSNGLLRECEAKGNRIWGLAPECISISPDVRQVKCDSCGHTLSCSESDESFWEESPCIKMECLGKYQCQPPIEDYFGDLYRSGDVVRIRSSEHTGLLEREAREWLETRFMATGADRRSTDPNLLSSTPTLEMGVNIGDLSSVVLCTVPPGAANYIQRVGRAGRKEGAAISLTIAAAQNHDLYYFELPEDMIAGAIRPPGVFLDAPAVLERQFTAFCIDRWSEQAATKSDLPHRLEPVLENVKNSGASGGFPYNFFTFVETNIETLGKGFLGLFSAAELSQESRDSILEFAKGDRDGGGLSHKILQRLSGVLSDREDLRARIKTVGSAIRKNRGCVARDERLEEELEQLIQSRDGINAMLKQINSKLTLNFLTDEGLLPNYAFPEEGIELRSVILRKKERSAEGEGKYDIQSYEYMRPAASAINELAPGSCFYVNGRRLRVDQVGLKTSSIETWHFCDSCNHMEPVSPGSSRTECKACGSPNWSDASLKRDLIRLRQVISTETDRNSRAGDEKDEREPAFFNRHESVVIPDDVERIAYQVDGSKVPFGFEFLSKFTLRIVNLGTDNPEMEPYRLGGRDVRSNGFALCSKCGKVQSPRSASGAEEMKHDLACPQRNRDGEPLQAVFLYRELTSEAVRVLLPSSSANEDTEMSSFVAALHLGLRLHFKGGIDHLKGVVDERPIEGTSLRRKYLVLYDQVPGGTGYLKQLSRDPKTFLEVFRKALVHLQKCECATREDHETDGCHRCILQARHRRDHANLSRQTAIRLLETILACGEDLKRVDSVSGIDIDPLIQSELEKSFLESLKTVPGAILQKKIVHGRPGYNWRCGSASWDIALQVDVSAKDGVQTSSRPDFILYPVRPVLSPPLAIFVDGFAFHADEARGNNRIARDVEQRQALLRSGNFYVWSFSWEDIQHRNDPAKIPANLLGEDRSSERTKLAGLIAEAEDLDFLRTVGERSSWSLFLGFLMNPTSEVWNKMSYLYALALPEKLIVCGSESATEAIGRVGTNLPINLSETSQEFMGGVFKTFRCSGVLVSTRDGITNRDTSSLFLTLGFADGENPTSRDFARDWRGFLRLQNRLQFLLNSYLLTDLGKKVGAFTGIEDAFRAFSSGGEYAKEEKTAEPVPDSTKAAFEMAHESVQPLLREIIADETRAWPEIGYELELDGRILAMAELAWLKINLAVVHSPEDAVVFKSEGWHVFTIQEESLTDEEIKSILSKLEESYE